MKQSIKPDHVDKSPDIIPSHRKCYNCIDSMFVNGIACWVTIFRNIKFGTAEMINNQEVSTMNVTIKHVLYTYKKVFTVHTVLVDGQFASPQMVWLMLGSFWIWPQDMKCPGHWKRIIKERNRATYIAIQSSPTTTGLHNGVCQCIWFNAFPVSSGMYKSISHDKFITEGNID